MIVKFIVTYFNSDLINMEIKRFFLSLASCLFLVTGCKEPIKNAEKERKEVKRTIATFKEKYRPQFHFSPSEKWMNDPNGLVYHKGVYHLFYQYYPDDIVWGPMHWGHAISKDMILWEHKPIALYPDENGLIFSGSAVVDKNNSSGFGSKENPPLIAIFTYHNMEGEKAGTLDFQTQGIAYSLDNGETWKKYEGNPVIPNNTGIKDFRDPKVFWHEASGKWILVLVAKDHARIYSSNNLKKWTYLSEFGKNNGAHGGVWECPDLFPLKVADSDEEKWVLIISINPGAPNGGSGTQYFIGDFDGNEFTSNQKEPKWIDYGTDNYAGITYNNTPNKERIFIGWMSNWNYARDTPTQVWRSAMTLPRELSLHKINTDYFLYNYPLKTLERVIEKGTPSKIKTANKIMLEAANFNESEVMFKTANRNFELAFSNAEGDVFSLYMNGAKNKFIVDRTKSGSVDFQESFGSSSHEMSIEGLPEGKIELRIVMDWSSAEVFINKGQYVMTQQLFPTSNFTKLKIENKELNKHLVFSEFENNIINSIWNE
ncbi:glycoside hydrolase family 32 protein [Ascidiimonas sp. W6]|uniref:glycoside hydrolase family 32 protein n=1 Tax=Ascidiimonas meishanensis TaxID=3128903 RepID=UPI0030EF2869